MEMDRSAGLYTRTFGHGPQAALALHCSLAHSGAWRGVAAALADRLTIRAVDLPGHGKSPDGIAHRDLTEAAVAGILPHLDRPMHLIGHSFGGVLALRMAIDQPEKVLSLSLFEPVLMAVAKKDAPEVFAENERHMDKVNAFIDEGDPESGARSFMRVWGDGRRWADLPKDLRLGSTRRIGFIRSTQPTIDHDSCQIIPRLTQIDVPTVIMDGAESPPIIKVVQDGIAQRIGQARRVTIEGVAHMGPITNPAVVAEEISRTIDEAD